MYKDLNVTSGLLENIIWLRVLCSRKQNAAERQCTFIQHRCSLIFGLKTGIVTFDHQPYIFVLKT